VSGAAGRSVAPYDEIVAEQSDCGKASGQHDETSDRTSVRSRFVYFFLVPDSAMSDSDDFIEPSQFQPKVSFTEKTSFRILPDHR
jgi:hypothetical protein